MEHTRWRTGQGLRDAGQVGDDRLDAIALSLDLGLESLHLVTVEGVGDILRQVSHGSSKQQNVPATYPANVDGSHFDRRRQQLKDQGEA